ncbi:uncharacterized protein LOC122531320 [Frieseomelitta varia]|uniref:uncharacterized protein LOC122531320 n=1 Tax=Frieseomelitta varia TaxID=561572 RepID=UPI001CB687A0|nr:uncharacterized protein LOC122531320 [Frieseomelitta varia]
MSVHGTKTPKFFLYIFILGTLILILDSYAPPITIDYEETFLFCHFHQIHFPKQAIEIARLDHERNRQYLLRETYKSKKYVIHFLVRDTDKPDHRTRKVSKIVPYFER